MHWDLVVDKQLVLSQRFEHEFFDWLQPRVRDHVVAQLDPFRDTVLDESLQERWLVALDEVRKSVRKEILDSIDRRKLPSDPAAQELIANRLVEREIARNQWFGVLRELIALLELAKDSAGAVRVHGD